MIKKRFLPLIVIGFCLLFGLLYLFISPPTTTPDEIAHLAYPRYLLQENKLPSFTTSEDFWESHQPPLYYILSLPIVKLFSSLPIFNQLQLDRIVSFFIYGASLLIFYFLLKKLFSQEYLLQATGLCFFGIPMVCYLSGSFSNDILMILISVLLSYWIFYSSEKKFGHKEAIFFGICLGLGLLTKVHLYPFLLLAWLFILWKKPFFIWLEVSFVAFLSSFWWFLHNLKSTGDIFGLSHTFVLWGSQQENLSTFSSFFTLCAKLFSGFMGVFGKFTIAYPTIIYIIAAFAVFVFFLVLIKNYKDTRIKKTVAVIFALILFVIIQNFSFYQPQGRYLVSIIPFIGIAFAIVAQKSRLFFSQSLIFFSFGISLIVLNSYGLFLIHSYYKDNPVGSLIYPQTINLLEKKFIGDTQQIEAVGGSIKIFLPATIATLQDFRLDSKKHPTVHIDTPNQTEFSTVLRWKRLGDTSFTDSRSMQQTIVGSGEIQIKEPQNTLIQDIQVEIQSMHDSITVTNFSIYAR